MFICRKTGGEPAVQTGDSICETASYLRDAKAAEKQQYVISKH